MLDSLTFVSRRAAATVAIAAFALLLPVTVVSAESSSGKMASCIDSQIKTSGRWTFSYPKKGTVGGRVTAQATIELQNTTNRACTFQRNWPKVRLLDNNGAVLMVHEQEIDGQDVASAPSLPPKETHSGEVISAQWINWCGVRPAMPIHIRYTIVPTRTSLLLTPRVKAGKRFHMPGCVNPEARSVLEVAPYLAFTAAATK